jgi:hypothetical protein
VWLVEYVSPNVLRTLAGDPTTPDDADWEGTLRLAVASPEALAASGATAWTYWDLRPRTYGIAGQYFDFGHLAVGNSNLYLSHLVAFHGAGANVVTRIPLSRLERGENLGGSRFLYTEGDYYRPVAQSTGVRAVFARHNNLSQMQVYTWDEGSDVVFFDDVGHNTIADSHWESRTPAGDNWIARGPPGAGITGATRTGERAWFAWSAGRDIRNDDGSFTPVLSQPHIQIAIVDVATRRLVDERYVWNPDHAFRWPALATNSDGEVGMSFGWGGGPFYANSGVAILTNRLDAVATDYGTGPGTTSGQDYSVVRQSFPTATLFAAANYVVRNDGGPPSALPSFTLFGRAP